MIAVLPCHCLLAYSVVHVVEGEHHGHESHGCHGIPYPGGYAGLHTVGIEPTVHHGLQLVVRTQVGIDAVDAMKQQTVVRHELIKAVRHVDRRYLQVVGVELVHEPLQRQRVPRHLPFLTHADHLYGLLHVVIGMGIGSPSAVNHEVMAEGILVNDDAVATQVVLGLHGHRAVLGSNYTVGEQLNGLFAVACILIVIGCIHAKHQVGMACLQVVEGIAGRFQPNDIGNVELLAEHLDQIDIEALGLALLVEKGVRPQVPCIHIDQWMLLCIYSCFTVL